MTIASRSEQKTMGARSEHQCHAPEEDKPTVEILRGLVAALKSCDQKPSALRPVANEN